jgi:hypothetical protein
MSLLVDPVTVATIELRRAQLLRSAVESKGRAVAVDGAPLLTAVGRRGLASGEASIHALSLAETSSTDILGYWSAERVPHRTVRWPERRVLLDWAAWCCLVLLAITHQIVGA